ncbi:hypothetical protein BU24DRAFT_225515 [Aaosphaeria arxii CBS 175.79]|uniref:Zn(2)-C6 fungal-type domain-containing protein n=1 Tax=Aaosphaeria arxii CBS 175.79 TaxID=1450172 RepID=A0A6A5XP78_9PLEO|nr:uncharacterized protein BU24DRAFT_225515 [Aaosphaeria arxii CBS 175.79]KAF2014952.1 hypothetical protein BU24DRAFT_225515 [Aaosphaeria arxii CBS 175.79]
MTTPRRKACVECRQQKIRCDVEQHKTPHDPCSRCQKMSLECRILPTSTRNLRQTKAEMRRELEALRMNLHHGHDVAGHVMQTPTSHAGTSDGQHYSPIGPGSYSNESGRDASASMSPSFHDAPSGPPTRRSSHGHTATLPRVLDNYVVDAKRIDDCFALFFSQYHQLLPILDPSLSANEHYELSPFLFWAIVVTGSRRYNEDPHVLDKISHLITPLAFSSIALRSEPIPVIQGLLILCTWRLPTNSMYKDTTHVLCGAAVHLATQIGLHVAGVGQDFARMPLKKDQEQKMLRFKLWMHVVIVSIRTSCAEGIPPLVIAESFFDGDEREREDLLAYLPGELLFHHKVHSILLRAMSAMVRTDLQSPACDAGVLRSLISIFDSQLLSLAPSSPSELDTFNLNCVRIHVLAFHFFANPIDPGPDVEALVRLYSLCILTVRTATSLAQNSNLLTICPSFIDRTLTLTGFAILKLVKSPIAQHLDLAAGEQAFFMAVQFSKNMSLQNGDLGERCAAISANLWHSTKTFRRKDGRLESLGLRLRTRLSMSVSFDMFWYWREEFGNMANPYNGEESAMPSTAVTEPTTPQYEKRELADQKGVTPTAGAGVPAVVPAPTTAPPAKFPPLDAPLAIQQQPQQQQQQPPPPVNMGFPQASWDPSNYAAPPMLDQFPDYDWAASFDFSNDFMNQGLGQMPPENVGYAPMNFG